MILPSMSEEQILQILIEDFKHIKNTLRKEVQKSIKSEGYKSLEGTNYSYNINMKDGNRWYSQIRYRRTGNAIWNSNSCCIVESDYGSKDYYLLRNANKKPYFIKLTSHAVKRIRERSLIRKDLAAEDIVMSMFDKPEIGVASRYFSVNELTKLYKFDDIESLDDAGYFIMFFNGLFIGNVTKQGNWSFQTHVSWELAASHFYTREELSMDDKQASLLWLLNHIHRYFNKKLWDEEAKRTGEAVKDSEELAGVEWSRESDRYILLDP